MEAHDIKKESKRCWMIGGALLVLTVITVGVSYLKVSVAIAIIIALLIASFKGSLVASFFMHLIAEKKVIYVILAFTVFFLLAMMIIFVASYYDLYEGMKYVP